MSAYILVPKGYATGKYLMQVSLGTAPDQGVVAAHTHTFKVNGGPLAIKIDVERNAFFSITSSVSENTNLPTVLGGNTSTKSALGYGTDKICTTPAWTYMNGQNVDLISGTSTVGRISVFFVKYDDNLMSATSLPDDTIMYITGVKA